MPHVTDGAQRAAEEIAKFKSESVGDDGEWTEVTNNSAFVWYVSLEADGSLRLALEKQDDDACMIVQFPSPPTLDDILARIKDQHEVLQWARSRAADIGLPARQ